MLCGKMVMFQKMGGMFQEALAMPGPVLSQASPAPSQAIIETTSTTPFSLQGQGAISFSQVGMFFPHILLNHTTCCKFPNISASSIFTHLGHSFQDNGSTYLMQQAVGEPTRQELLNQLVFNNMCSFQ